MGVLTMFTFQFQLRGKNCRHPCIAVIGVLDMLGQWKVWSVKNCKDPNIRLTTRSNYTSIQCPLQKNSVDHMFSTVVTAVSNPRVWLEEVEWNYMESKNLTIFLVCLGFLWFQIFLREQEKIYYTYNTELSKFWSLVLLRQWTLVGL